jgi:hypothetical protein
MLMSNVVCVMPERCSLLTRALLRPVAQRCMLQIIHQGPSLGLHSLRLQQHSQSIIIMQ